MSAQIILAVFSKRACRLAQELAGRAANLFIASSRGGPDSPYVSSEVMAHEGGRHGRSMGAYVSVGWSSANCQSLIPIKSGQVPRIFLRRLITPIRASPNSNMALISGSGMEVAIATAEPGLRLESTTGV